MPPKAYCSGRFPALDSSVCITRTPSFPRVLDVHERRQKARESTPDKKVRPRSHPNIFRRNSAWGSMNTKALQKRISEGNIFPTRQTGEWPCCELHAKAIGATEEAIKAVSADTRRSEFAACHIPDRRVEILRQAREVAWGAELSPMGRGAIRAARGA